MLVAFFTTGYLCEHAPRGQGEPVMVLPGFMADDRSARLPSDFLKAIHVGLRSNVAVFQLIPKLLKEPT